jgi:hypothetical protein
MSRNPTPDPNRDRSAEAAWRGASARSLDLRLARGLDVWVGLDLTARPFELGNRSGVESQPRFRSVSELDRAQPVLVGVHPLRARSQACRNLRDGHQLPSVVLISRAVGQVGTKLRGQLLEAIVIQRAWQSARKLADECATDLVAHHLSTARQWLDMRVRTSDSSTGRRM